MSKEQLEEIKKIRISIATKEQILEWSNGEVTKPETINYKTYKHERDGLFDELIFGPSKDYRCPLCEKKQQRSDVGKRCPNCGNSTILPKSVRRRLMGHIELGCPISHIWFAKVDHSVIRTLLDLKQDEIESLIYYKSHIVYDVGSFNKLEYKKVLKVSEAPIIYRDILNMILKTKTDEQTILYLKSKINELVEEVQSKIGQNYGIDFYKYNKIISDFSDIKIDSGAEVLKILLNDIDLKKEKAKLQRKIKKTTNNSPNYRRLRIIESFIKSKQNPASMILDVIPIIPVDTRPLIQLDGGKHSSVDLNELYRRIIVRNNRLKNWNKMNAPKLIVQNEKRMLQELVDALFDNARKPSPILSKDQRPLKSLAENIKGKQGRFRQNLLGKRVDYSGRSVIAVGPDLKLNQVGLPKQMIVKLFEPFIVRNLVEEGVAANIRQAKKMIELLDDKIWKYTTRVIKKHPVLLNRAPTLHRLSIQAFEPIITPGKSIRLHPLVTPSFNADFDGDQMAVHLPLSDKAKEEARQLMFSRKNILGPKDGKLIFSPSQDIVLGLYYLTTTEEYNGKINVYSTFEDTRIAYQIGKEKIGNIIVLPLSAYSNKFNNEIKNGYKYFVTTMGRLIINNELQDGTPYINNIYKNTFKATSSETIFKNLNEIKDNIENIQKVLEPWSKSNVSKILENQFEVFPETIQETLDSFKDLGFKYSTLSGISVAVDDVIDIPKRNDILKEAEKEVQKYLEYYNDGLLTDDQRYLRVIDIWAKAKDEISSELKKQLQKYPNNNLRIMMESGARGSISNFIQLGGMRGSMSKAVHEYAALKRQQILVRSIEEIPIKSSFKTGLSPFEFFLSTHGARKGLSDTATKTAESGYLTRRLVDTVQDISIIEEDCGTNSYIDVKEIIDTRTNSVIESLGDRIKGRYAAGNVVVDGKTIIKKGDLITEEQATRADKSNVDKIKVRSSLTCKTKHGICAKCFGKDLTTNKLVNVGEAIGIVAAQSIGEPGTQLTMRQFHTGGVSGVADITQGFARLMELVDANKNPKSPAIISKIAGEVVGIERLEKAKSHQNKLLITIENDKDKEVYETSISSVLRVDVGSKISVGDKITEGSINLKELLDYAGIFKTQAYLTKEIQRLYRVQGISISDKYMEIIIKQMLSKIKITDPGSTKFYISQVISKDQFIKQNAEAFKKGKEPAFGIPMILGAKPLPLYSESFLAAASYQKTAEVLVNASIANKVDNLFGIKENLIIGKQIPVGTGVKNPKGKYDIFKELEKEIEERKNRHSLMEKQKAEDIQSEEEIIVVNE